MGKTVQQMTDNEIAEELESISDFFADPDWFHHGKRYCDPLFARRAELRAEATERAQTTLKGPTWEMTDDEVSSALRRLDTFFDYCDWTDQPKDVSYPLFDRRQLLDAEAATRKLVTV